MKFFADFENVIFWTTIPVLVNHLNYGNHLGYDSYFSIIQEARMRWLKQYDMGEKTLDGNIGYFITEASVSYKSEAFHGDQLKIGIMIDNIRTKAFDINYVVLNLTRDVLSATAKTSQLCFNFELKKIASLPSRFLDILNENPALSEKKSNEESAYLLPKARL